MSNSDRHSADIRSVGPKPNPSQWLLRLIAIFAVVPIAFAFLAEVDLSPTVDQSFFFASDSAAFRQAEAIKDVFPSRAQIVISATSPAVASDNYFRQVEILSERLLAAPGATAVKSISHGPGSYQEAADRPFWRSLLVGKDGKSTFIIVFADADDNQTMMSVIEDAVQRHEVGDFTLRIAGPPYVVENIRRGLTQDMKTFTLAALAIFAGLILVIYRSPLITIGMIVACADAVMLTFLAQSLMGQRIGVLTANLGTIVVVLTLSHTIFLTANWRRHSSDTAQAQPLRTAMVQTLKASFWCMVTTALGFASLFLVDAQPLRELGIGGAIGTVMAILSAYVIYPAFLLMPGTPLKLLAPLKERIAVIGARANAQADKVWAGRLAIPGALLIATCITLGFGVPRLNTDPSLLSYFDSEGPVYKDLAYIDGNGGSSPLTLVVKQADGGRLDNSVSYGHMWDMQGEMSVQRGVGTIVSLPVLMAEGDHNLIGSLLPWNWLLDILSSPRFEGVARTFITEDRTKAMFVIRMEEQSRVRPRVEVVADLEKIAERHGFTVTNTGGVYYLQGKLAELVGISLFEGLALLVALFWVVALILARSLRGSLAMLTCIVLLPAALLGGIGMLGIPLDIIAAPATNVCIGMAVDAMIHLTVSARRNANGARMTWAHWVAARQEQWRPAVISAVVVGAGFSIFALSSFPPSQRFGITVAVGAMLATALALTVLPLLAASRARSKQAS